MRLKRFLIIPLLLIVFSSSLFAAEYIPVEAIDSLKSADINAAIRNIKIEAESSRAKYLLREMERINYFESSKDKHFKKKPSNIFNVAVAYHNLYLFLMSEGFESEPFFKKALKYYKIAGRDKLPARKNNVTINIAALYGNSGEIEKSEKLFSKVNVELFRTPFRRAESLALYYSAIGDAPSALASLKELHSIDPERTKLWLSISDDFVGISDNPEFVKLLKKWKVKR